MCDPYWSKYVFHTDSAKSPSQTQFNLQRIVHSVIDHEIHLSNTLGTAPSTVCVMKFSLLRKRLQMMNLNLSRLKINLVITKGKNYIFRKECKLSKLVAILKPRWKMLPEMNVSRNFES